MSRRNTTHRDKERDEKQEHRDDECAVHPPFLREKQGTGVEEVAQQRAIYARVCGRAKAERAGAIEDESGLWLFQVLVLRAARRR